MVGINECLNENQACEGSCTNIMEVSTLPYLINANKTALVGVRIDIQPECTCGARNFTRDESCRNNPCHNGGRCVEGRYGVTYVDLQTRKKNALRRNFDFKKFRFPIDVNVQVAMTDLVVSKLPALSAAVVGLGIRRWKCAKIHISVSSSSLRNRTELCSTTDRWCPRNRRKLSFQV